MSETSVFRPLVVLGYAGLALLLQFGAALACGVESDCKMPAGTYRVALPKADPVKGAIVFIHGYRGTAAGILKNKNLLALGAARNMAVIAAQSPNDGWNIPNSPSEYAGLTTDTLAYFDALRRDVMQRFQIKPGTMIVAGFSSGGMMTWHLACNRGSDYAGFVPMSGTFWDHPPTHCPTGAVNLIHYHGRQDTVVPLDGRKIGPTRQGKVAEAIAFLKQEGDYQPDVLVPAVSHQDTARDCEGWRNEDGKILQLCLYDGGHRYRVPDLARALDILLPE